MEPHRRHSTHNNIVHNEEEPSINPNNETERNRNHSPSGGGDGGSSRNHRNTRRLRSSRYYSQFHITQFYEAAEDEQFYTDEYISFIQTYERFVLQSNAIFSRIENGLRENINRSIVREHFYYNRFHSIRNEEQQQNTESSNVNSRENANIAASASNTNSSRQRPAPTPAPAPIPNNNLSRIVARELLNVLNRDVIQHYDVSRRNNVLGGVIHSITTPNTNNSPTEQQINSATINCIFSHITRPTNTICPISRDEFVDTSEVTQIRSCKHIFNRTSLRAWFRNNYTCPLCRYDIRTYSATSRVDHTQDNNTSSSSQTNINNYLNDYFLPLRTIIHNNTNSIQDIHNQIIDNSGDFTNPVIEHMNEDEITFSFDLPYSALLNNNDVIPDENDNDNENENENDEYQNIREVD